MLHLAAFSSGLKLRLYRTTLPQWLGGRASDYRRRRPWFELCAAMLKPWTGFVHSTLLQLTQLYGWHHWLQTVVDMCTSSLRALIAAYGWMLTEQVCQGGKVYSALSNPEDWIPPCIRTNIFISCDTRWAWMTGAPDQLLWISNATLLSFH